MSVAGIARFLVGIIFVVLFALIICVWNAGSFFENYAQILYNRVLWHFGHSRPISGALASGISPSNILLADNALEPLGITVSAYPS